MKVIDVINLSGKLLNEIDIKSCIDYCIKNQFTVEQLLESQETLDFVNEQSIKDLRLILDSINITLTKIATENFPTLVEESIIVENNKFSIDNLSQKLFKIKEITCSGVRQKFSVQNGFIMLPNGSYTIKYAFLPTELTFDDEVNLYNGKLSILTLSYGACAYFALIKGIYNESEMWNEKFEFSLQKNFARLTGVNIKKRRWL